VKLTTKSEYALLAMIHIARHQENGFIKIEDICERYEISRKYLEQLLTVLKQSGYIRTRRGAAGGYKLGKPANRISLADVIRLMDGALAPTESVSKYFFAHTAIEMEPKMMRVLRDIRDYIARRLEHLKLSDLV
jgi:Rrf2 family protein